MSRRPVILVTLALVAGLLGYGLTRLAMPVPEPSEASAPDAQFAWLKKEFAVSDAGSAEIRRLQLAYAPICEDHCAAVVRAQAALRAAADDPAARAAASAELARLKTVCSEATRAHLQSIAAQMPPAQAARFLAMMESRVAHDDARGGAPALTPASAP